MMRCRCVAYFHRPTDYMLNAIRAPIDYLEFGVYEGVSIRYFAERHRDPESRFVGFDTFSGLPENWREFGPGHFDVNGRVPSIKDSRVSFVPGLFQDTLPTFLSA